MITERRRRRRAIITGISVTAIVSYIAWVLFGGDRHQPSFLHPRVIFDPDARRKPSAGFISRDADTTDNTQPHSDYKEDPS